MHSSLIGKVEKAKRYAQEPDRVTLSEFSADFRGEHSNYTVNYKDNRWHCTCQFFSQWKTCSHTMALQQLFVGVLPKEAVASPAADLNG
ncbi:MAG: hypothetical protein ISS54_02260 [Dehalococcoidia bacterium]|nr:hypothetical protein [Dehalococcoidia bacterium]